MNNSSKIDCGAIELEWKDCWLFPDDKVDRSCQDWYYNHLHAAHEARLWNKIGANVVHYRFTYLRSFDPTLVFHIERNFSGIYILTTTKLTGNGNDAGEIDFRKESEIDKSEILILQKLIEDVDFWNISRPDSIVDSGMDGSHWLFEVVMGDKYHVVYRQNPSRDLAELGKWFMRVSRIAIQENDIY